MPANTQYLSVLMDDSRVPAKIFSLPHAIFSAPLPTLMPRLPCPYGGGWVAATVEPVRPSGPPRRTAFGPPMVLRPMMPQWLAVTMPGRTAALAGGPASACCGCVSPYAAMGADIRRAAAVMMRPEHRP